jgi:hypothetical protein
MLEFGYSPPPGDREMGRIDPATFVADLDRVVDAAVPWASSIWTRTTSWSTPAIASRAGRS